ncbi:hypothetical protein ACMZZG_24420 [Pseudocitrobacter faecalis]|uniref:hypothetical protein n=1 Tax=Pseudocitrobacter faecalis TaxID=1398493 RepID=UPI0039EF013A
MTKVNPGVDGYTFVQWKNRFIQLDSNDVERMERCSDILNVCRTRTSVMHEIGHTLLYLEDEYDLPKPSESFDTNYLSLMEENGFSSNGLRVANDIYGWDIDGVMNIGAELRERYLDGISVQLDVIIPDTSFSLAELKNEQVFFCFDAVVYNRYYRRAIFSSTSSV